MVPNQKADGRFNQFHSGEIWLALKGEVDPQDIFITSVTEGTPHVFAVSEAFPKRKPTLIRSFVG